MTQAVYVVRSRDCARMVHSVLPESSLPNHRVATIGLSTGAVLLLAALACLVLRIGRPPVIYDEGLVLAGADRLLQG